MIDNMLTLLQANSHVYVDVRDSSGVSHQEVNRYIRATRGCRFGPVFGTPTDLAQADGLSISIIQNAGYLTPQQKRDILIQQRRPIFENRYRASKMSAFTFWNGSRRRRDSCLC